MESSAANQLHLSSRDQSNHPTNDSPTPLNITNNKQAQTKSNSNNNINNESNPIPVDSSLTKMFRSPLANLSSSDINSSNRAKSGQINKDYSNIDIYDDLSLGNHAKKGAISNTGSKLINSKTPTKESGKKGANTISNHINDNSGNNNCSFDSQNSFLGSNSSGSPTKKPENASAYSPQTKANFSPSLKHHSSKSSGLNGTSSKQPLSNASNNINSKQQPNFLVFQMKLKDIEIAHLKKENAFLRLRLMNNEKSEGNTSVSTPKRRKLPTNTTDEHKATNATVNIDLDCNIVDKQLNTEVKEGEDSREFKQQDQYINRQRKWNSAGNGNEPKELKKSLHNDHSSNKASNQYKLNNENSNIHFPSELNGADSSSSSSNISSERGHLSSALQQKDIVERLKSIEDNLNSISIDLNKNNSSKRDNQNFPHENRNQDDTESSHPSDNMNDCNNNLNDGFNIDNNTTPNNKMRSLEDRIAQAKQGSINLLLRDYNAITPSSIKKRSSSGSSSSSTASSSSSSSSTTTSPLFSAPKLDFTSPAGVSDPFFNDQSSSSIYSSSASKIKMRASNDTLSLGNVVDLKGHPVVPLINLPQVQNKMSEWKAKYTSSSQ